MFDTDGVGGKVCEVLEPEFPISKSMYVCSNKFYLEPLLEMTQPHSTIGVVLVEGEECRIYTYRLTGTGTGTAKLLAKVTHCAQKNQKNGGQSQARIGRLRVEKNNAFYTRIVEKVNEVYLREISSQEIQVILIAGPAETKDKVAKHQSFDYRLTSLIKPTITCERISDQTIHEIGPLGLEYVNSKDYEVVKEWLKHVELDDGFAVYGEKEVTEYLSSGCVKTLIISSSTKSLMESSTCEIVVTNHPTIKQYGGVVGILWYNLSLNTY